MCSNNVTIIRISVTYARRDYQSSVKTKGFYATFVFIEVLKYTSRITGYIIFFK